MKKIVVSAKFKGDTKAFTHGESYLIAVAQQRDGIVSVTNLITVGNNYFFQDPKENYATLISFLADWDEITSYPSLSISDSRKL